MQIPALLMINLYTNLSFWASWTSASITSPKPNFYQKFEGHFPPRLVYLQPCAIIRDGEGREASEELRWSCVIRTPQVEFPYLVTCSMCHLTLRISALLSYAVNPIGEYHFFLELQPSSLEKRAIRGITVKERYTMSIIQF